MEHAPTITTADGPMQAYVAVPDAPTGSAVVVLMEAFGVNAHIRDVCDRVAAGGSVAVAPDLYHRQGAMLTGPYDDPSGVMGYFAALTTESLAADIDAAFAWARASDGVDPARVGALGFCLGGYGAFLAAARSDAAVAAGFYGAGIAIQREGSPLEPVVAEATNIGGRLLLMYGADDPVIPHEEIEATRSGLEAAGVDHSVTVYEGAGHGFFCDARSAYVPDAAAAAWKLVADAFDTRLGSRLG